MRTVLLLLALAGATALASTPPPNIIDPKLRPTFGGAYLEASITSDRLLALTQVWSPSGRLQLYRCDPSCREVNTIPIRGTVKFTGSSPYRIILGGRQASGKRHDLYFSFEPNRLLRVAEVPVGP